MDYEIANPHPAGTIESLRSLGYSTEAAVADLVDNSIAADARQIDVIFTWDGRDSWVAVTDDGHGMTEAGAGHRDDHRGPRSRRHPDGPRDLGRFGMGLKTASFSQARTLIVTSAAPGQDRATRVWDLDLVRRTEQWRLLQGAGPADAGVLGRPVVGHGAPSCFGGTCTASTSPA